MTGRAAIPATVELMEAVPPADKFSRNGSGCLEESDQAVQRGWGTTSVGVPALWSIGGALMFGPSDTTHWAACAIFFAAALWLVVMGMIWFGNQSTRDWTVWLRAAGLVVIILIATPIMIYFAWPVGAQSIPPGGVNGNCNNFGNNNFNCNTLIAPHRVPFTNEIGQELLGHMTNKGKPIALEAIGSPSDWRIADEIQEFLRRNGYTVNRSSAGTVVPQPEQPFSLYDGPTEYQIIVAPSAH